MLLRSLRLDLFSHVVDGRDNLALYFVEEGLRIGIAIAGRNGSPSWMFRDVPCMKIWFSMLSIIFWNTVEHLRRLGRIPRPAGFGSHRAQYRRALPMIRR